MKTTFASLQQSPDVDPQDLIDTLMDYAETRSHIIDDVVIEIIQRTVLSMDHMRCLLTAAEKGVQTHQVAADNVPLRHVPPEVNAAALSRGGWLEVLQYEEDSRRNKKRSELDEASNYRTVAEHLRQLLILSDAE